MFSLCTQFRTFVKQHATMDKQPATNAPLLTVQELAQVLKVSSRTVELLIRLNRAPPFIRVGRARRWRSEDIDAWLAEQVNLPHR